MIRFLLGGIDESRSLLTHFLGVCCIILAFFVHPLTNGEPRYGKDVLFVCFSIILCAIFSTNKKNFVLFLVVFHSCFFDIFNIHALYQFIMVCSGVIIYSVVYSNEFDNEIFGNYLVGIGIAQSVWFIVNYFGYDPFDFFNFIVGIRGKKLINVGNGWVEAKNQVQLITGSLSQHTLSGVYFILAMPYAIKKKWPFFLIIPGIILTGSTMVQLGCIVAALAVYFPEKIVYLISLLVIVFFINVKFLGYEYLSGQERLIAWEWGINNLKFFGNSLGHWANSYSGVTVQRFNSAHNEILEFIYVYGIISLIPIGYFLIKVVKSSDIYLKACLIGLLFNCLGNFPFHLSPLAMIGIILLANITKDKKWHLQHQN